MQGKKFLPLSPMQQVEYARQLAAEQQWMDALVEVYGTDRARQILLSEIEAELQGKPQYKN